jgi:hypothetical protein
MHRSGKGGERMTTPAKPDSTPSPLERFAENLAREVNLALTAGKTPAVLGELLRHAADHLDAGTTPPRYREPPTTSRVVTASRVVYAVSQEVHDALDAGGDPAALADRLRQAVERLEADRPQREEAK